jgi:hypothetical protein
MKDDTRPGNIHHIRHRHHQFIIQIHKAFLLVRLKKFMVAGSARPYAPGQRKKYAYHRYPLVVIRTPDIIIRRYNDGRYYYRNPEGYMYWKGYDDRFYLDEQYLNDNGYNENEYNDWKYKGRNNNDQKYQKGKNKWKD